MANQTETEVSLEAPQQRVRLGLSTAYSVSRITTIQRTVMRRSTLRNTKKKSARSTMPASCALGRPSIRLQLVQNMLNAFSAQEYIISTTTAGVKLMNTTGEIRTNKEEENDYLTLRRPTITISSTITFTQFMMTSKMTNLKRNQIRKQIISNTSYCTNNTIFTHTALNIIIVTYTRSPDQIVNHFYLDLKPELAIKTLKCY